MKISVEDKTKVDKILTISATREELEPRFEKAYRTYRKKINMPGFRPGQMPLTIIKKRFGKDIESEEINNYVQEIFRDEVVPKYSPIGEPKFDELKWDDKNLEVKIEIGVRPEFELTDISKLTIDKMVHDVTDKEVDEELEHSRERAGTWKESEEPVQEKSKVTIDAVPLDEKGNPKEEEKDTDKSIDLSDEQFAPFKEALLGKKKGDEADVELAEGDDKEVFRVTVKSVQSLELPELNDEFVKKVTNEEITSVEDFRSHIKSQIQNYFDQVSGDIAKQEVMDELIKVHDDIDVPDRVLARFQQAFLDRMKQQQQGEVPEDFNEEEYLESIKEDAAKEARWAFILDELEKKYDDVEITPEDVDAKLAGEAARYGMPVEMIKNFYAQSNDQLENLRKNIRADKVFEKILNDVQVKELSKEEYQEKKKKERNEKGDS
ncbi:trigger factor [Balneolaceae bacterium ANBcel3]|nr:trigger factor [Balneolaceae bacterium ANBcel3]